MVPAGKGKQAVWTEHSRRCCRPCNTKPLETVAHSKNCKPFTVVGFMGYEETVRQQKVQIVDGHTCT